MSDLRLFLRGRLCRADVHKLIKLHGIGAYNLAIHSLCKLNRIFGFSYCGRAAYADNSVHILLYALEELVKLVARKFYKCRPAVRTGIRIVAMYVNVGIGHVCTLQ